MQGMKSGLHSYLGNMPLQGSQDPVMNQPVFHEMSAKGFVGVTQVEVFFCISLVKVYVTSWLIDIHPSWTLQSSL